MSSSFIGLYSSAAFSDSTLTGKDITCLRDADCGSSGLCILSRCLSVQEIASLPPFCGNARTDLGEECDAGSLNADLPNAYCRTDCTLAGCGDGIIDTPIEQCDDGNVFNDDGCSSLCLPERAAPTQTLPAQVIELPFTDGGDRGQETRDKTQETKDGGSVIGDAAVPPSTPDTGPATLAVMISGAAAGLLYRRKKKG